MESMTDMSDVLLAVAKDKGYIKEDLHFIPELAQHEEKLFKKIDLAAAEQYQDRSISFAEIENMFKYAVIKGYEVVYHWHSPVKYEYYIDVKNLFNGRVKANLSQEMAEYVNSHPLSHALFTTFQEWLAANKDKNDAAQENVHDELMDALKWTFRIAVSMGADFLGY